MHVVCSICVLVRSLQNGDDSITAQELENSLGGIGGEAGHILERVAFKQVIEKKRVKREDTPCALFLHCILHDVSFKIIDVLTPLAN